MRRWNGWIEYAPGFGETNAKVARGIAGVALAVVLLATAIATGASAPAPPTHKSTAETSPGLQPFGYEVFQGNLQEASDAPVDQDYLVGPRDELLIETWGDYVRQYPVRVTQDGYIDLEAEQLRIYVNGLTLREVEDKVLREMSRIHASIFNWQQPTSGKAWVSVTPMRVRNILVYVAGEVGRPGTLSISPTIASLINVLILAGGVLPEGSLRNVKISRLDGTTETYDLYGFLLRGETAAVKTRLNYGETVFVGLKRRSVTVKGHVRRPGIYEVLETEGLSEVLDFAGGPAPGAYLDRVQVTRQAMNEGLQTLDVDYTTICDAGSSFPLQDGDVVEVFPAVDQRTVVYLEGNGVFREGLFEYRNGMTLLDLLARGEGLRSDAYLKKIDLIRTRPDFTKEYRSFSLESLYRVDPDTGRMEQIGDESDPANFDLRRLDRVIVYSYYEIIGKEKFVTLEGHVKDPGVHLLADNLMLSDLLFAHGGFEDSDWKRATYLPRADLIRTLPDDLATTIIPIALDRVLAGDSAVDLPLKSMDRIKVYSYDEIVDKDKFVRLEGHVKQPGLHPLSRNMTIADLLFAHGGLEDLDFRKATYLERADLYRTNPDDLSVRVIPVDLRRVLAGDSAENLRMQSLDRLLVYEYEDFNPEAWFSIEGAVRRPGRYRLALNTTLADAIVLAHGLEDEAYKYEAEIVRTLPEDVTTGEPAMVYQVPIGGDFASPDRREGFAIAKDDSIFIRTAPGWAPPRKVAVAGELKFPGDYILAKPAERLSDLIERAGGLKDTAYPPAARLTRRIDTETTAGEQFRVAIDLAGALARPGTDADAILRDGDRLVVPVDPMTVEVRGAVQVPATLHYRTGARVSDYIARCGGYREGAFRDRTLTINPDGTTARRGWAWFEHRPQSGSIIVVPSETMSVDELVERRRIGGASAPPRRADALTTGAFGRPSATAAASDQPREEGRTDVLPEPDAPSSTASPRGWTSPLVLERSEPTTIPILPAPPPPVLDIP